MALTILVLVLMVAVHSQTVLGEVRKNFVLVYGDDLRPDLMAAYGGRSITPNLDLFSKRAGTVVFEKAYSNYPMCGPSRTSTLFGRLPISTGIMSNLDDETKIVAHSNLNPSLPKYLQSQGYFTATGGKVFHEAGINGDKCWNMTYEPTTAQPTSDCIKDKRATRPTFPKSRQIMSPQICITKAPMNSVKDIRVARKAVRALDEIVKKQRFPFFLAVGFYKPHVPIHVHRNFWRQVPAMQEPVRNYLPGPESSYYMNLTYAEDGNWALAVKPNVVNLNKFGKRPTILRQTARRAYAAAVMQTDYAFGIVWNGLVQHNLLNSTMVVFVSDHGYALGESNLWAKNALFESMLRVPLMINVPWHAPQTDPTPHQVNRITTTFVELVDLYRTTTALLNIGAGVPSVVDGIDHSELIIPTIQEGKESITPVNVGSAVSVVARCSNYYRCSKATTLVTAIGFSIRTPYYRYNVYLKATVNRTVNWDDTSSIIAEELYSHSDQNITEFNYNAGTSFLVEYENIAPGNPELRAQLYQKVRDEFLGAKARFTLDSLV